MQQQEKLKGEIQRMKICIISWSKKDAEINLLRHSKQGNVL